jgi:hypothetical protein
MKMGDTEQIEKKKKSIVRGLLGSKGTLMDITIIDCISSSGFMFPRLLQK